jgi:hypothetical protein
MALGFLDGQNGWSVGAFVVESRQSGQNRENLNQSFAALVKGRQLTASARPRAQGSSAIPRPTQIGVDVGLLEGLPEDLEGRQDFRAVVGGDFGEGRLDDRLGLAAQVFGLLAALVAQLARLVPQLDGVVVDLARATARGEGRAGKDARLIGRTDDNLGVVFGNRGRWATFANQHLS